MSLQARMAPDDPRLYDPSRDVAHNHDYITEEMTQRLTSGQWKELNALCTAAGVTDEEIGKALKAYCHFVASAAENPRESMAQCLDRCGWFDMPAAARIAVVATLGTLMAGLYFHGSRMATLGGSGPADNAQSLRAVGVTAYKIMAVPRWRRPLTRLWWSVTAAIGAARAAFKRS